MKKTLKATDYNEHKYWAESSDLTERRRSRWPKISANSKAEA